MTLDRYRLIPAWSPEDEAKWTLEGLPMTKDEFLADAQAKLEELYAPFDVEPGHRPVTDAFGTLATHEVGRLGASLGNLGAGDHVFSFRFPDGRLSTFPFHITVTPHPPEPPDADGRRRVLAPIRSYEWREHDEAERPAARPAGEAPDD